MAATLTRDGELTYFSFPIEKSQDTENINPVDGTPDIIIWGKATDGTVDGDLQIVDPEWSAKALHEWLDAGGNVRMGHDPHRPVGKGIQVEITPDGHYVKSLIADPTAKHLVRQKVLNDYSVGISMPDVRYGSFKNLDPEGKAINGIITGRPDGLTRIAELSVVDRGSNFNTGFNLVKSAANGAPEFIGKMFGSDLLTKTATVEEADIVTVDLPKDVSVSFSPADLAKLMEHKRLAEKRAADANVQKREFRPEVGGGVDVDKLPSEDFVDPKGRRFPIASPGDVSDAVSSYGRAKPKIPFDEFKKRLTAIAERKGDAFVRELPQAWKEGDASKAVKKPKGKKPAFPGAHPAFTEQHQPPHDDADLEQDEAKPTATKGMKDCPGCGAGYDADSKMRKCEKCGMKLPKANKSAKAKAPVAVKGDDMVCLGCGHEIDDDDKFCSNCGKANPDFEGKADKPTPGKGVTGEGAASIKPVPAHREPDGEDVEEFEHDAGLPTVPDKDVEMKAALRLKSLGVPTDQGALHDLLCPAYHPDEATKCHPTAQLAGMDVTGWQAKALDAATGASLQEAVTATQLWQHATTLKGTDQEVLDDLRHEVHKAFRDANPGPGTFPKPTELSATSFRRPYLAAGHAAPSPGQQGPTSARVPSGPASADQFGRGYLDAGHAADSPSNKSVQPAPVPTGAPQRTYYRNTQRDAARSAMQAMHDHIASTFPDLCPMSGPGVGGEPPVGARPVPTPEPGMTKAEKAARKLTKLQKRTNKTRTKLGLDPVDLTDSAAPVTKAATTDTTATLLAEMREEMQSELKAITKTLHERTEHLQAAVDALGDQPDPKTAPFKGVAQTAYKTASPAGALSVAETAERTQLMMMRQLEDQFRTSPDPAQREAAWNALVKMRGLPTQ